MSTVQNTTSRFKLPKLIIILALALVAVVVAVVIYQNGKDSSSNNSSSTANTETLKGPTLKQGVSFYKPPSFKRETPPSGAEERQATYKDGNDLLAVIIAPMGTAKSESSLAVYAQAINDPKAPTHQVVLIPVQKFIESQLSDYEVKLEDPKAVKTANLPTNTWSIGFSATSKDKKDKKKGEVILAARLNDDYYFMLITPESDWQGSADTWKQIVNSIKVNQ